MTKKLYTLEEVNDLKKEIDKLMYQKRIINEEKGELIVVIKTLSKYLQKVCV